MFQMFWDLCFRRKLVLLSVYFWMQVQAVVCGAAITTVECLLVWKADQTATMAVHWQLR